MASAIFLGRVYPARRMALVALTSRSGFIFRFPLRSSVKPSVLSSAVSF
jgi:hypothetical protein